MMDAIVSYASAWGALVAMQGRLVFSSEQPSGSSLPSVEREVIYGTGFGFYEKRRASLA